MSNVFSRSWEITKLSFGVIKKDKELLIFPILSSIFSLIYMIGMAFPIVLIEFMEGVAQSDLIGGLDYLYIFLWYFGTAFIATFFNVCVAYTAKIRFEGGNATLGESLKYGFSKFFRIFQWSLLSATVGVLLYALEVMAQKAGNVGYILIRFLRSVLAMAWNIVTLFVIPVLVYYDLGPFDAIKKSTDTLKRTWGEALVRHYGMGIIRFLFTFLAIIVGGGLAYLLFLIGGTTGLIIGIGLALLMLIIVILVFGVADQIFTTALFVYGDTGKIPGQYDRNVLENGFRVKKERART
jgi:hypothetical protein